MPGAAYSFRLFEVDGIPVFLHWSWFLVAIVEISNRRSGYSSFVWNILEYLALFLIVLLHEFGHALACRSVGGRADQIMLWPLGGVAFVKPPARPGATLWSIAAGPAVNVILIPLLATGLVATARTVGTTGSDLYAFWKAIGIVNFGLLLFNLLPVYPLDGGQLLGALLWFIMGRPRGLMVTAVAGLVGVAALGWLGLRSESPWLLLIALFAATRCISAFRFARLLMLVSSAPGRSAFSCPSCAMKPPEGGFWKCPACGVSLDVFDHLVDGPSTVCPRCHTTFDTITCFVCGESRPASEWEHDKQSLRESPGGNVRFRAPQLPSIRPLVIAVCVALVAATALFIAAAAASRLAFIVAAALVAAVVMPVLRYRRNRNAFEDQMRTYAAALARS